MAELGNGMAELGTGMAELSKASNLPSTWHGLAQVRISAGQTKFLVPYKFVTPRFDPNKPRNSKNCGQGKWVSRKAVFLSLVFGLFLEVYKIYLEFSRRRPFRRSIRVKLTDATPIFHPFDSFFFLSVSMIKETVEAGGFGPFFTSEVE